MSVLARVKRKVALVATLRRLGCERADDLASELERLHEEDVRTHKKAQKLRWRKRNKPNDADLTKAHSEACAAWEAVKKLFLRKLEAAFKFVILNSAVGIELVHPDTLEEETNKLVLPETLPVIDVASVSDFCRDFRSILY